MVEQFLLSQVLMIHRTKFGQCAKYLSHLVIDAEHVHDVDPDVDGVDEVREREVKLVVAAGQAEVLAGREGLGTSHLRYTYWGHKIAKYFLLKPPPATSLFRRHPRDPAPAIHNFDK